VDIYQYKAPSIIVVNYELILFFLKLHFTKNAII
jgi:hypothetical protein